MPEAILKFNLPEENNEYQKAINGASWAHVVWELDEAFLRNCLKYGHEYKSADEALEAVRDKLRELMEENDLNINMAG